MKLPALGKLANPRAPEEEEVAYVPGPIQERVPREGVMQFVQKQVGEAKAHAVPRSTMDDVALAKQALLDAAYSKPRRGRRSRALGPVPLQAAVAGVALVVVAAYVPVLRPAIKAGLSAAMTIGVKRFVSRVV